MKRQALLILFLLTCQLICPDCIGGQASEFSEDEQLTFIRVQNGFRQSVYPPIASMLFMDWSHLIASTAGIKVNCDISQNSSNRFESQFLAFNTFMGPIESATPANVSLTWYAEKSHFSNLGGPNQSIKPGCPIANFTNMMKTSTGLFGCQYKDCSNNTRVVVCAYTDEIKYAKTMPKIGPSCSRCPKDSTFCFNGLCIGNSFKHELDKYKKIDLIQPKIDCRIGGCRNCASKSNLTASACQCLCDDLNSGSFCAVVSHGKVCGKCAASLPPCLNGGVKYVAFVRPSIVQCACFCPPEFVGQHCEIEVDKQMNSVKVTFASTEWFRAGALTVLPPVSPSQFNSEIWTEHFRSTIAAVITRYCRDRGNYALCCPNKIYDEKASTALYVGPNDVKKLTGTVGSTSGGGLQLLMYIEVPKTATLCSVGRPRSTSSWKLLIEREPIRVFVRTQVIQSAMSKSEQQIYDSLPPSIVIKAVDNVESRTDLGVAYGPIWSDDHARLPPHIEPDHSNISTCLVEHRNSTETSFAVRIMPTMYFYFTAEWFALGLIFLSKVA